MFDFNTIQHEAKARKSKSCSALLQVNCYHATVLCTVLCVRLCQIVCMFEIKHVPAYRQGGFVTVTITCFLLKLPGLAD